MLLFASNLLNLGIQMDTGPETPLIPQNDPVLAEANRRGQKVLESFGFSGRQSALVSKNEKGELVILDPTLKSILERGPQSLGELSAKAKASREAKAARGPQHIDVTLDESGNRVRLAYFPTNTPNVGNIRPIADLLQHAEDLRKEEAERLKISGQQYIIRKFAKSLSSSEVQDDSMAMYAAKKKKQVEGQKVQEQEEVGMFRGDDSYLPERVNLAEGIALTYDQGGLGSCTANSLLWILHYYNKKYFGSEEVFSRLYNYYFSRELRKLPINPDQPYMDPTLYDSGAPLTDAIESIRSKGIVPERLWPYTDQKKSDYYVRAPFQQNPLEKLRSNSTHENLFDVATKNYLYRQNIEAYRLPYDDIPALKRELAKGNPIYIGIWCTESFMSEQTRKTGYMPIPNDGEKYQGGHAMVVVGYDDPKKVWIVQNSWGKLWGDKGKCYLPYNFLTDKKWANDLIKIKVMKKSPDITPIDPYA